MDWPTGMRVNLNWPLVSAIVAYWTPTGKLKSVPEGGGTLLDNCMIAFGSAIADPNRHAHHDLPVLLVGRGGGTIKTGRYVRYKAETPLNNLWLAMLERFGAKATQIGDSTGVLDGLE